MILGVGCDILSVERMRRILADEKALKAFVSKTYTDREILEIEKSDAPLLRYATHFAGKEAVFKSLGISSDTRFFWRDIEVLYSPCGQPTASLHGEILREAKKRGASNIHLSLSYDGDCAEAFAVTEKTENNK